MNIVLLYLSPNKTTHKVSLALARRLEQDGHSVSLLDAGKPGQRSPIEVDPCLFENADVIGVGSPVFNLRILRPLKQYLRQALPHFSKDVKAFIYITYGGITSGKAFLNAASLLKQHKIPVVGGFKVRAPHFYSSESYPDAAALQTIDQFCAQVSANLFRAMPWPQVEQAFGYQGWKVRLIYPFAQIVGELRRLPIHFDTQRCLRCQRCIRECPANALKMDDYPVLDKHKCVHCYHCATICPQQAILCPTYKVEGMAKVNVKLLGHEQPQNAIYLLPPAGAVGSIGQRGYN
ncbi:hypothetical protein ADN00_10175 [Ornatilinea apprima]|uniref:4Fe-4S ferredoxin-type domain-containing protein n=1 Tax=Ornatilinea apprima TaxID=1134406 RepID=A0A0P6XNW9_9CHLR|nr:EFR1 family ferrodoxin [Ornatilinea apprima]KPL76947.1 hypothetical protein ADN00_10175 [Ornatilinea apprima]